MKNKPLSLLVPVSLLNQIRNITTARKNNNQPNSTQKAVIIELLQNGLVVTDTTLTPPQETKEVNNTLPMF